MEDEYNKTLNRMILCGEIIEKMKLNSTSEIIIAAMERDLKRLAIRAKDLGERIFSQGGRKER
jgi:hypothetical protein